ncbi:MAG: hypothetical protein A2826_03130 [Candidatus Doudnabacteria bacterium RIFCSPHIGHO2_01_FULL_43_23]|uniref:Uncharacterized protein n=1 Tax=Candidatus Doudnabacteria bacterium RIFCSPHIGHO2_01_FULL_43_23 TaxID=1817822 RepID=A0A1F5NRE0_9BACT|nr:MAG: hypothetical protein A2826_03130 [Candidatus Doudnabacteria bacterium RIFCSPHIGHO2_01_FULL_43_23]
MEHLTAVICRSFETPEAISYELRNLNVIKPTGVSLSTTDNGNVVWLEASGDSSSVSDFIGIALNNRDWKLRSAVHWDFKFSPLE